MTFADTGPRFVNWRPSVLADASILGKPDGLTTRQTFTAWILINVAQHEFGLEWRAEVRRLTEEFGQHGTPKRDSLVAKAAHVFHGRDAQHVEMRLRDAREWCECTGKQLRQRLARLMKRVGSRIEPDAQERYGILAPQFAEHGWDPFIQGFEIKGAYLRYAVPMQWVHLPRDDHTELLLEPWRRILGQPTAWRALMQRNVRAAAKWKQEHGRLPAHLPPP